MSKWKVIGTMNGDTVDKSAFKNDVKTMMKLNKMKVTSANQLFKEKTAAEEAMVTSKASYEAAKSSGILKTRKEKMATKAKARKAKRIANKAVATA